VAPARPEETEIVMEVTTPESPGARRTYLRWIPLLALGLFALLPPPSLTTAPDTVPTAGATIEALEQSLMVALKTRDQPRLEELIAADCELEGPESNGARTSRHAYVAAAVDPGQLTIDDFHFADLSTTIVAPDVAVARATVDRQGWWRGRRADERLLLTDVWKRRDGRWQLVSRHTTRLPPP
jgi:ketosteroid isomerase-like protein